ncbi:MAG: dCTP deaminase, partial [Alphaproteobacteria bacterium]|nr:dCTP deaminase [Alphaproteobacteria bacterium]
EILVESKPQEFDQIVSLSAKESPKLDRVFIGDGGYIMKPNRFILASTIEMFNLPNDISCEFKLKSSVARAGLNNMLAVWVDPGFNNSRLTLELKNDLEHHSLLLNSGMKIGQMVFYRCHPVPMDRSYAVIGRYNNSMTTTASQGV